MSIVLVPGFMLDADLWTDVMGDLSRLGPVLHADLSQGDTIEAMAAETLKTAPPHFDLVGFSMGGYVAREMQRQAPGRVGRLALVATSARGDNEIQARRKAAVAGTDPAQFRGITRTSVRRSLAPEREGDAALVERIRAMSIRLGGETFARQAALRRAGDLDQLGAIACPTLVVAGRQDRLRSLDEAQELADGIPGAKLTILDAGHMIPIEAPGALADALCGFLGS